MESTSLKHWGIKGMKWGVHRYQNSDGSLTSRGKKRYSTHEDYEKAHSKKHVSEMSDHELKERNNRLNMEKQYRDLTKKKNIGSSVVKGLIAGAGTIVALEGAYRTYKRVGNGALDAIGDWVVKGIDLTKPFA